MASQVNGHRWKEHGNNVVQVMLDRLVHLQLVRVHDSSSTLKLTWDVNGLGKHVPSSASPSKAPSTTAAPPSWTTAMADKDLAQVKKSLLHQLKLFSFYRIQNIHQTIRAKYPPPQSFDLDAYADHLVHMIEKDKRLVVTEDDAGNPAFTWADKSKVDALKDPLVPNNRHVMDACATSTAATIAETLAQHTNVPMSTLDASQPSSVRDKKVWLDAVLAALWKEHKLRVDVLGDVLARRQENAADSRKRARSPERQSSATWDKDTAEGVGQEGLYFNEKERRDDDDDDETEDDEETVARLRKKHRLHEVQQPVMEWYTPPLMELPSIVPVRPTVIESSEYKLQKQRALFIRDNVEVPYQQAPDLPTKPIALDYPY
ncbi:hypothetical protein, variant [Aphanomyces invadans]|uniref:Uncharacterized protein n=1 Tax=Aphanomyces invadans TaxID=157072 RepID=A0A024TWY1_9STRA|nr:hypothetical protein, variant [Aphanomyces invadans]ETV98675.1 hypothetical protein, variant [Aphanomyces invadans]|eukprot:XP_008872872.1 hypothetical protein, variant [Aphanomyces invadans]